MNSNWPMFSRLELTVGNPKSNTGICILWSSREEFISKYIGEEMKKVALVGNLYSIYGLGILIRNYLSSPTLQHLFVTGKALGMSKGAIENLKNDGTLPEKLSLSEEHIKIFLERTKIIFLKESKIKQLLSTWNYKTVKNNNLPKIVVDLPEPRAICFPGPKSGHLIRVRTIEEGYKKLLKEIMFFGHITNQDSEGQKRKELWELNMIITDQDPQDFSSVPHPEYGREQIKKYCEDFWRGSEPEGVAYRYGDTIRHVYGDQVENIKLAFKDKAETFRTFISLWNPRSSIKEKDPPCIVSIHLRIIRDSLHLWAYIRTNDMFGGWPLNAAALRYFQYKLLEELKVELKRPNLQTGELGVTSGSAHLYERNWPAVDSFLSEEKIEKFYPDSKGNFEVKIEGEVIVVNHYSPDGAALLQVFKGKSARELSKQIEPFISQIKHAIYLGRELQKAETEVINVLQKI